MTETEVTSTETTEVSNDTVTASQNDTVASGASDTVASGEADAKPTNEFSWNDFVAQLEAEDKKVANVAKMYSNPKDTVKALYEANKKISKDFKEPELPKNATE